MCPADFSLFFLTRADFSVSLLFNLSPTLAGSYIRTRRAPNIFASYFYYIFFMSAVLSRCLTLSFHSPVNWDAEKSIPMFWWVTSIVTFLKHPHFIFIDYLLFQPF